MSSSSWDKVVHEIRRIGTLSAAASLSDGQLLDAFVNSNDAPSFEVLVRRYGRMVYGVCRRVLRHDQDAEDAFQATFLVLVRKAATLQRGEGVGNWLYGVAYRTALQARSRSARRRVKESETPTPGFEDSALDASVNRELQALLDRELNRLPKKYRAPVILCDLLGKTKKQAGQELGCPEGTVSSRLARGREILKNRLARHESAFAGVAGVGLAEQMLRYELPLNLCSATVKAGMLIAKGTAAAAALSPAVAVLVKGVMKSMLLTKLKSVLALFVVIGVVGGTTYVAASALPAWPWASEGEGIEGDQPVLAQQPPPKKATPAPQVPVVAQAPDAAQPKKEQLRYDGKSFDAWRDLLVTELKPEVQCEAINALAVFGVNGYGEDASIAIVQVMNKYEWRAEFPKGGNVISAALSGLAQIGVPAIPALSKEIESKNSNNRLLAIQALQEVAKRLGSIDKLHAALVRGLKDEEDIVRGIAIEMLMNSRTEKVQAFFGTLSRTEKEMLVSGLAAAANNPALADLPGRRASNALKTLTLLPAGTPGVVPALSKLLADENGHTEVRFAAANSLAAMGPAAKDAVPALIGGLQSLLQSPPARPKTPGDKKKSGAVFSDPPKDSLSRAMILALEKIGPDAKPAVPVLVKALGDNRPKSGMRPVAKTSLQSIGPAAIPALVAAVQDEENSWVIKTGAAEVLGHFGPAASEAVPALIAALKDDQGPTVASAAGALIKIGPGAKTDEAVAALLDSFSKDELYTTAVKVDLLGAVRHLKPPAKKVVPHLGAALGRTRITEKANEAEFTAICDYLAALGPEAKDAVPPLIMLLNSVPPTLEAVIRVLGEIGPAAKEAVPRLMEFRQSEGFSGLSLLELGRLKKTAAAAIEKIQK